MVVEEKSIRRKSNVNGDDDDWLQDLADDAVWKRIQQNTFTRWANEHLKTVNKYVACLESDMSDGIRLLALVEVLSGKKLPKYNARPTMKAQKLNNVDMALRFLQDVEKVKLVNISSGDIVDGNLKLILGLMWTLILHYSISMPVWEGEEDFDPSLTPKQRLLKWIQSRIPEVPVNNFTTDWNDGKAIGALVDSMGPGLCPDWKEWTAEQSAENIGRALQLADDWLDVPQLIKPKEMANRKVDELSMMTYLSQFPSAKLKENAPIRSTASNPNRVRCYGPGLQPVGVCAGAPASFTVDTFSAGKGKLDVQVRGPDGQLIPGEIKFNDDKNLTYTCSYTAQAEGEHTVTVTFDGQPVPKSPFKVNVKGSALGDGYKKCKASGPGLEAGVRAGQPTHVDISTAGAGAGQLEVLLLDEQGKPTGAPCRLQKISDDQYRCDYVPDRPGKHQLSIQFAGKPIPGGPFPVKVEPARDPRRVRLSGRGLQPSGLRVGERAQFTATLKGKPEEIGQVSAKLVGPDGKERPVNVSKSADKNNVLLFDYTPDMEGDHRLSVSLDGIELRQIDVHISPPSESKVVAYGPGLYGGVVGSPNKFRVDTRGERGTLGFTIDGPGEAKISCKDNGDGTADVEWTVPAPGEYALHVMANGEDIPNSPYCAKIRRKSSFDPDKFDQWYSSTHASELAEWRKERTSRTTTKTSSSTTTTTTTSTTTSSTSSSHSEQKVRKMVAGLPSTLTIKVADPTDLEAFIEGPDKQRTECQLEPHDDGKLTVAFTATQAGEHLVHLQRHGKAFAGSPFKIQVSPKPVGDPTKVSVDTEQLQGGKVDASNSFFIDTRGAGAGGKIGVSMQGPCKPEVSCAPSDQAGVFKVSWRVTEAGSYTLDLRYEGVPIPGSPFDVIVASS